MNKRLLFLSVVGFLLIAGGFGLLVFNQKSDQTRETSFPSPESEDQIIPADPQNILEVKYLNYVDEENSFGVVYPETWEIAEVEGPNVVVKFAPTGQDYRVAPDHILIQVENDSYATSLDSLIAKKTSDIAALPKSEIISSGPIDFGESEMPGHQITFEAQIGDYLTQNTLSFVVHEGKAYVVSYNSTPATFEDWLSVNQNLINSFTFEPKEMVGS